MSLVNKLGAAASSRRSRSGRRRLERCKRRRSRARRAGGGYPMIKRASNRGMRGCPARGSSQLRRENASRRKAAPWPARVACLWVADPKNRHCRRMRPEEVRSELQPNRQLPAARRHKWLIEALEGARTDRCRCKPVPRSRRRARASREREMLARRCRAPTRWTRVRVQREQLCLDVRVT